MGIVDINWSVVGQLTHFWPICTTVVFVKMKFNELAIRLLSLVSAVSAITIAEINGNRFLSPYKGQTVTGVEGVVTAKGPNGFWIRSMRPDNDERTSESIYVCEKSNLSQANVGDAISLNGRVSEYRSLKLYRYLSEIDNATNITLLESGKKVTPINLGFPRAPPTQQHTSLDNGDTLGTPDNVRRISEVNPVLEPRKYGLDF
ncbi:Hypothetical protein R9X50_00392800 [Acrodontium crateriforme]|uniref:Uncharacterized protein n=1 Tax=Acrodontium crateriforme TaxID=150365 RepID=A0AAQ3RCA1_9PEZI|nr:Hypothetical protein R9X50_00392800 [Acrodontium crateriforme]